MKKLSIALLLLASLLAFCPVQGKVVVGQLTANGSNYTLTFLALDAAPTYVTSGEGYYDLSDLHSGTIFRRKYGPGYSRSHAKNITRVVFDASLKDAVTTSTRYWLYNLSNLKSENIINIENLNTSAVTQMDYMFYGCSSLTSLDVSKFNTAKVTTMSDMFYNCSGLKSLDLRTFDTSAVKFMSDMFQGCSSLTSIDVTSFNTAAVLYFTGMFAGCSSLTSIDVSSFDTKYAMYFNNMFYGCSSLTSIDVSNFNTSSGTRLNRNIDAMFQNCSSLTSLDISNFECSNAHHSSNKKGNVAIENFASGCTSLRVLNMGANDFYHFIFNSSSNPLSFDGVGTASKPCYLIFTFPKDSLKEVTIRQDTQTPPYYNLCDGYFTIADTLDSEKEYAFKPSNHKSTNTKESDLWVKARTLKANVWNTLVIPAGTTQEQLKTIFGDDVQVCYIYSYANNKLTFKTLEGETRANMPVLVKPSTDIKNVAFANVELEQPGDLTWTTQDVDGTEHYASFIGSYKQSITIGNDCFYYYDGKFLRSAGGSIVNNTRGYFKFSDITAATPGGAKEFVLDDGTGNATSIDAIDGELVSGHAPAYNLSGQRVGDDYRGIVIVQGKKYLRK